MLSNRGALRCCDEGLQVHFDHLGFFNVHQKRSIQAFLHFATIRIWLSWPVLMPVVLCAAAKHNFFLSTWYLPLSGSSWKIARSSALNCRSMPSRNFLLCIYLLHNQACSIIDKGIINQDNGHLIRFLSGRHSLVGKDHCVTSCFLTSILSACISVKKSC